MKRTGHVRHRVAAAAVVAAAVALLPAAGPLAAGGTLDPSFGSGGKTIVDAASANAVGVAPDGKLVLVYGDSDSFAAVRLNSDGSLDSSFDGDGRVVVDVTGGFDDATAVAFTGDGKLLVAGNASASYGVVRLNTDGSLDTTFDGDGRAVVDLGGFDLVNAVAADATGRVVIGGQSDFGGGLSDFGVVRLTAAGALDPTFDGDGIARTDIAGSRDDVFDLVLQPDGKIVAAGAVIVGGNFDFGFARYLEDGSLDATFSGDGKATVDFGAGDTLWGLDVDSEGRIVGGGYSGACCTNDFVAVRLAADGTLDPSFGGDGKSDPVDLGGNDLGFDALVDASDRVVVVGSREAAGDFDWGIVRFSADGTRDASFGTNGVVASPFADGFARAFGAALQADGKVVVAGAASEGGADGAGVARLLSDDPNAAPAASFTVSPASGTTATTFSFDGGGSTDPDGDSLTYAWAFGDGAVAAGASTTHGYAAPGTYTVTLTVDDGRGGTNATTRPVTVAAAPTGSTATPPASGGGGEPSPPAAEPAAPERGTDPPRPTGSFEVAVRKLGGGAGTVRANVGELTCGSDCSAVYRGGTTVALRAVPSGTSSFRGWGGACSGAGSTCTLTVEAARLVTARFERRRPADAHTLVAVRRGQGVVATWEWGIDGRPIDCGLVCANQFRRGSSVRLLAVPATGYDFAGWTGSCAGQGSWCTLTMSRTHTTQAQFAPSPVALTVSRTTGGAVASWEWSVEKRPVDCGTVCVQRFLEGAQVRVVAVPAPGYDFAGWTGACAGQGAWCTLTMTAARSTHADFVIRQGSSG